MKRRLPLIAMLLGSLTILVAAVLLVHVRLGHHHKHHSHGATKHPGKTVKIAGMQPVSPNASIDVVAVQKPLTAGTLIKPGMLIRKKIPASAFRHGDVIWTHRKVDHFVGAMLRTNVPAQAPLTNKMVLEPGDHGFLSAVLRPGHEAITIGVDAETDSAGLVWPGDHVAVTLIRSPSSSKNASDGSMSATPVVSDARVVATGGALFREHDSKKAGKSSHTVTLGVTPRQAEFIDLAEKLGSLSISPLSARHPPPPAAPAWAYQVTAHRKDAHPGRQGVAVTSANDRQRYTVP